MTVVYCCDHEPHSRMLATDHGDVTGQDLRYAKFLNCADLLIHDANTLPKSIRPRSAGVIAQSNTW